MLFIHEAGYLSSGPHAAHVLFHGVHQHYLHPRPCPGSPRRATGAAALFSGSSGN